jgi:hypothetical protein
MEVTTKPAAHGKRGPSDDLEGEQRLAKRFDSMNLGIFFLQNSPPDPNFSRDHLNLTNLRGREPWWAAARSDLPRDNLCGGKASAETASCYRHDASGRDEGSHIHS